MKRITLALLVFGRVPPVKPPGPRLFFGQGWGKSFLTTNSVSLLVITLFRFSISF